MKATREPASITGARAPLFDRLLEPDDETPAKASHRRVLDLDGLRNSVAKELGQLLNTRSHSRERPVRSTAATVLDYGLLDFSHVSAASDFERAQWAQLLADQIQRFEPRLAQVRVTLAFDTNQPRSVIGSIEALLSVESISEPVSFPLLLDPITGQTRIE